VIQPMDRETLAGLDLVPQALIQIPAGAKPPSFPVEAGEDDFAAFRAAPLMLDGVFPFALFRYETAPQGELEIRLPHSLRLDEVPRAIRRILTELELPVSAVKWQRESADAPF
jgi:hypothetical protein